MRNLKFYGFFLALTVVFSFNSCSSGTLSPSDTIIKAYDLTNAKQYKKATALYVSSKGQKFSEEESKKLESMFPSGVKQWNEEKDGFKNVEITEEVIEEDGNSAKVSYIVHFNNGDTDSNKVKLVKIDGKWFIKIS